MCIRDRIYAAASLPLLDPNDRENIPAGATELKVVTHLFELGSIFKSVSAMAILESGTMTPESELFCPSEIEADGYIISDAVSYTHLDVYKRQSSPFPGPLRGRRTLRAALFAGSLFQGHPLRHSRGRP